MANREYVNVTSTAKLLRVQLGKAFPGIKFSVRSSSYAGDASIDVKWIDGPLTTQVDAVCAPYKGGGFDGMIDMAYCVEAWLMPDGTAVLAGTSGTAGSMGAVEKFEAPPPAPDAKRVRFGADYIFCTRAYSVGMYTRAVEKVVTKFGLEMPEITVSAYDGTPRLKNDNVQICGGDYLGTLVYRDLSKRTNYLGARA